MNASLAIMWLVNKEKVFSIRKRLYIDLDLRVKLLYKESFRVVEY